MYEKPLSPAGPPDPRPEMELAGHDGNIFAILGRAGRLLKQHGQSKKVEEMNRRVFDSASYNEALGIISEYVHTELSGPIHNRIHLTEKPLQHDTAILVVVLEGYNATGIAVMDEYAKAGQE